VLSAPVQTYDKLYSMYKKHYKKDFRNNKDTSWQKVSKWYNQSVGDKGQYFHQKIILPKALKLLNLRSGDNILDLGCGQGVLSRNLPSGADFTGVDLSKDLIKQARERDERDSSNKFIVGDITKPLDFNNEFSHTSIILALQNVENQNAVIANAAKALRSNGKFLIVLNHPIFRIPRQTAWGIDEQNKQQYRKIFKYMTELKIPIDMTPGKDQRTLTWSFHKPLSYYSSSLNKNGFVIERLEEWVSDKESVGKAAKMENRSREEIPMFMGILARKL
jgi:ubiquinone/menaquinone biosynthesis C-methylase UbiE